MEVKDHGGCDCDSTGGAYYIVRTVHSTVRACHHKRRGLLQPALDSKRLATVIPSSSSALDSGIDSE